MSDTSVFFSEYEQIKKIQLMFMALIVYKNFVKKNPHTTIGYGD